MEICFKKYASTRKREFISTRVKFGWCWSECWRVWGSFINWTFITETWKAPMFFCAKIRQWRLVIWTCRRLRKKGCFTLRQELPTMRVLKCEWINPTIQKAIYGLVVALSTSLRLWNLLSELQTWTGSTKKWSKGSTANSQVTFL